MNSGNQQLNKKMSRVSHNLPGTGSNSDNLAVSSRGDLTLILMLVAIFIFHSPFTDWWSGLGLPWYSIFVFWLLLIVLLAANQVKKTGDNHR